MGLNWIALSGRILIDDQFPRAVPSATMVQAIGLKSSERVASATIAADPHASKQALKAPTIIAEGSALGHQSKEIRPIRAIHPNHCTYGS